MAVYTVDAALTASDPANNQFKTIQEAIDAARGADPQSEADRITIEIKASAVEYTGVNVAGMSNSVLNLKDAKFITLAGAGAGNTVFRGQINVANSEGITIENMTITADGTNSAEFTGNGLIDARQQGVKDLIIRNNVIALENCDHASAVKYDVIDLYTQTGSKENVTISGNTISGGCYSIRLDRFNNGATVIADNVITGSQRAINVDGMTGTVEITGNSISNVLHKGIQIAGTAAESVTISENTIQVIGKDDGSAALVYHETLNTTSDFAVTDNSLVVTTQGMPVIREEGSVVSPTQTNNYMQNADGTLADGSAEPETSVAEFLVSADWSEITSGGVVSYNGKFYTIGTNAFGDAKAALNAANTLGGTLINLTETGYVYAAPQDNDAYMVKITNAGTYNITGGKGVLLNYEVELNPDKADGEYIINMTDANLTATKLTLRNNAELNVTNSRIDYNQFQGGSAYLSVYTNSVLNINNSIVGYNPYASKTADPEDFVAAEDLTAYWAWGTCLNVYGTADIKDSDLFIYVGQGNQAGFDVLGNGTATLTNSNVSLALLNVGGDYTEKYLAADADKDNLVATLTLDNSRVKNTQYRGDYNTENGINVGNAAGTTAGKLTIKNGSDIDFTVRSYNDAREIGLRVHNGKSSVELIDSTLKVGSVSNAGTVSIDGSSLNVKTVTNNGSISVTGNSKLNIESLTGNVNLVDGANLSDSVIGSGTVVTTGNVTLSGNVTLDKFNAVDGEGDAGNSVIIAAGADVRLNGEVRIRTNDVVHIYGALTVGDAADFYKKNGSEMTIYKDGVLTLEDSSFQNNSLLTVYGEMNLNYVNGWAPKLAGNETGKYSGQLVVDGKDGKGIVNVKAPFLTFGGGLGSAWKEAADGCTVDILNNGKIVTDAKAFWNSSKNTLTLNHGSLIFDAANSAYDSVWQADAKFDNDGVMSGSNSSVIDMSDRTFTNNGSVTLADSTLTAGTLVNNSTVNVSGADSAVKAVFSGSGSTVFTDVVLDADWAVSGSQGEWRFLGDSTVAQAMEFDGRVYAGTLQTADETDFSGVASSTLAINADFSASALWIGAQYADGITDSKTSTVTVNSGSVLTVDGESSGLVIRESGILNIIDGSSLRIGHDRQVMIQGALTVDGAGSLFETASSPVNIYKDHAVLTVSNGGKAVFGSYNDTNIRIGTGGEIVLKSGILVLNDTLNINDTGSFSMDYLSTVSFAETINVAATASLTIDTTGFTDGIYKLMDYTGTGSYSEEQYKVLLGSNWDDACYSVIDNDLYLMNVDMTTLKVDATWAGSEFGAEVAEGYYYGINAFSDLKTAALSEGFSTIDVAVGTYATEEVTFTRSATLNAVGTGGVELLSTASSTTQRNYSVMGFGSETETPTYYDATTAQHFVLNGGFVTGHFMTHKYSNVDLLLDGSLGVYGSAYVKAGTQMTVVEGASMQKLSGEFMTDGQLCVYGELTVNGELSYHSYAMGAVLVVGNDKYGQTAVLTVSGSKAVADFTSQKLDGYQTTALPATVASSGRLVVNNGATFRMNGEIKNLGSVEMSEANAELGKLSNLSETAVMSFSDMRSLTAGAIENLGTFTLTGSSMTLSGQYEYWPHGYTSVGDTEMRDYDYTIDNKGMLNIENSSVTINGSLTNSGTVNVSGTSALSGTVSGNGEFNILGGTEDAPTRLSGKITSDDKDTDLTLKEGTILLGADADISLNGYEGDVYSEFIVGGTDNTTTDVTDVTMSDGAKVSAQRVWIGGEYDKEKDTAAHTLNVTGSGTLLNGHSQIGVNIRRDGVLNVSDGGEAKASDLVVRGTITVDNAKLTANGGNVYGEGNNIPAVITVENKGVFTASGTQVFQIGHASAADRTGVLNVKNGSIVTVNNLKLEQSGFINMDYTSTLAFDTFVSSGTITVDTAGFTSGVYKIFDDLTGSYTETEYRSLLGDANWNDSYQVIDNDLYLTNLEGAELYVDSAWASKSPNEEVTFVDGTKAYYKLNAFDTVANALALPSGETAYENAVKLNITGAVKSNISVIGSNITEVNSAAKTADENAVIAEDALTVNLVQVDNTEAGWEVYYPLASGSSASVYGGITTNFVSGLFTFETTRDPNIIGGAYGASDAKIYGSTTVNIGTDGGSDSDVDIYVDALVGSGGGTINGNSSVNIYSGTIERTGSIIGGSSWGGVVKGDSSVNIYGGNLIDSSDGKSKRGIMGGSYNGVTEGNASVNIYGGTVNGRIYAGGSQAGTTVKGNASVNISDGVVNGSIYGTGGVVEGSISISVTGGTIKGNIYAGGLNVGVAGTKTVNISDYSNPDKDNKNHFYGGSSVTQSGTADALLEIVDGDVIMNVADTEAYADIFGGASVTKSNYVFVEAGSSDVTVKNLLINGYDSGKTIWTGRVYGAGQISNSGNSSVDNYDVYYQASSNVHVTNIGGITVNKDDGSVTHNPGARVYGGGYLYWSRKSEMTVGSTNVVVDEDLQKDSDVKTELAHVIGGSLISGTIDGVNASTIITGNTDVTVNAGVISAWLVGGNNSNWFGRSVIGVADENGAYEYNGEKYSAGSTKVTLNDGGSETLSIIGGSLTDYASYYEAGRLREAVVFGKTEIIMNGGTAYEAVGGGYALYQNQNADTSGKLTGVENPLSNVEGETNVTVNGGTIKSNVIGGGYAYSNQAASLSSIANVTGNTFVAIGGTAAVEGNVYGGGYADGGEADVTGNTSVNVTGGTVAGNIYGGGYHANVNGNATVTITGGTVSGDIYGSGEGEATVNGSRTLNLGSADAAAYAATLNNVYDFNVAQIVNADVTVTGDFSVEEITIAGATLTLNSGFLAATTAVTIEVGAYNMAAAALNVGVSGVNQPSITISAAEELTAGRYLVASGFDSLSGFTVDGINGYTLRLQGEDVYLTKDLAPDDYDANGRPDILMLHDIGKLQVGLVQEDQSVTLKDVADLGDGWTILGSGQSGNGENYADIYLTNGETVGIWQLDETTGVAAWQEIQSFDSATHVLGLGDFNGDGITDLLLQNDNGAVGAYHTSGENVGWNYFQSLGSEWSIAGIGDFNHDGIDDVVLQNEQGGYAGIWQLDRDGQVSWSDLDVLNNGQIAGTGDFNGDGFDDVLLKWGNSYGAWTVSGGNLSGWMDLGTLEDGTVLEQIGDFNGDGIDDLRVRSANGDLGAVCVLGEGNLQWNYLFSVGSEWQTNLVSI